MPVKQRFMPLVIISLVCSLLGQTAYGQTTPEKSLTTQGTLPLDELRTFVEVFERIKSSYVEPIDDKTLMDNAIKGMVSNLDPHSAYLDAKMYSSLEEVTSGQFGGLGIEIEQSEGFIKIVTPIDDSPAAKAGIKAGDIILRINDTPTKDLSLTDASEKMQGKIGEKINLIIVRGQGKPFTVTITRAKVQFKSVKTQLLEKDYGYIRIAQFQNNTGKEVKTALTQLAKQNNANLKGIVLDLRNNPGGVLQASIDTVDQFVDKELVVYTKGRLPNTELRFYSNAGDPSKGVPLVVLINNGSASAAEVVAGALQDLKRAVIMGTTSFGKGSVQTVLPINKKEALKLTTALYYTPKGRSIQAQGIVPDIIVAQATVSQNKANFEVREADLQNHLNNAKNDIPSSSIQTNTEQLQNKDYQLSQALSLLKGLNVVTKTEINSTIK
ncbi:S41 family peptidase [Entomomonas asaccharolytica]|uniref:S41 family peptidase n=1 Tax=Entomomonas asaccharolytica TaxID=2785331 RepID=A0A974NF60_9GAMM|nr:S41 family peptidase [Entomomonas asaccharolytica]QQP85620.1 S41 family peptidase [Entomomonas asaccharolytica]